MTYAVLYTAQLEPITVLHLAPYLWRILRTGGRIQLPVFDEPAEGFGRHLLESTPAICRTVSMWGEIIVRRGHDTLMLFTDQDELALRLRSDLLPGQRADHQQEQRTQFARGFFHALERFSEGRD